MFHFNLQNTDHLARAGIFSTPHGEIQTPIFMPVATKSTVKGISGTELDEMGAQIILNNTYHLYLTPGDEVVQHFGGVHKFMNYHKPILTDSGGFQVFSLGNMKRTAPTKSSQPLVKITEEGVHFRSYKDGSKHYFTAEKVMDIQSNLGADIIMAFDECAEGNSTWEYAKSAMERTHRWAERSFFQVQKNNLLRIENGLHSQALFPIIQGVTYDDLRIQSAQFISAFDTPGIAIGGLSVGESKQDMYRTLDVLQPHLPTNKPRYLMGVGTPEDLVEGIKRGVDLFDCVLPTRLGRHKSAFSSLGYIKMANAQYRLSDLPLDPNCDCKVCRNYSKGYLRHLVTEDEMHGLSLLSYHNLYFLIHLTKRARVSILSGTFESFYHDFRSKYQLKMK